MTRLALSEGRSATSAEMARVEGIPPKYLEGIMTRLKAAGLVEAVRGKHGGYRMASDPGDIPMLAIVEAMDGSVRPVSCVNAAGSCSHGAGCLPRHFWLGLKDAIDAYLGARTLRDIMEGPSS